EKIMTMIIEESGELALDLEALINATLDKIDSPVCWQLGEKVLLNCAAKLRPPLPDMEAKETIPSISETSNLRNDTLQEAKETIPSISETSNLRNDTLQQAEETIPSISETSNLRNDTTHKIKVKCLEESIDTVQTLRNREHATTDEINHIGLHTEDGKKKVSSDEPAMPSKSVTEVTGKRKRNNKQGVPRKILHSMTHVQGYKVKKINAPILEAIFKKHGDIASDCVLKTASVRESILQVVCEVVKRIQTNDVATIISDMEEI
nr:hypothetical protein [Tanacetum cinerariifolium]